MNPFDEIAAREDIPSPSYVIDTAALRRNLKLLDVVQSRTGARILLALKGFSLFHVFPLISEHLCGTTASSLNEARLGHEEFGGEVHVCAPAYRDDEMYDLLQIADHMVFNSFGQWRKYESAIAACGRKIECGLRVNPEHSEVETALYDPCRRKSRLGITVGEFDSDLPEGISGLHFHSLCEVNSDALERALSSVRAKFDRYLRQVSWLNLGGGHHVTRPDYDLDRLCRIIDQLKSDYDLDIYLEPGEAVVLNTGCLVASVMDIVRNDADIAILDTSCTCHMPDVLEMPYRPELFGAGRPGEYSYSYILGGNTCLAGDEIGEYSFPEPLKPGDRLVFGDMAHYTMVKNTMFNGINLPAIVLYDSETGQVDVVRRFSYGDFRSRLG